jgi:hypothetical protein
MSLEKEPKTYSEFKAKRLETIRQIDYNKSQISFHKAQLAYLEKDLLDLDRQHESWKDKLTEQRTIENKISIQEVADMLAVDSKRIEDKILTSKAQKLIEQYMKGYK